MGNPVYVVNEKIAVVSLVIISFFVIFICLKIAKKVLRKASKIKWQDIKNMLSIEIGQNNLPKLSQKNIYKIIKRYIKVKRRSLKIYRALLLAGTPLCFIGILMIPDDSLDFLMSHYWIIGGISFGLYKSLFILIFGFLGVAIFLTYNDLLENGNVVFVKKNIKENIFDVYIKDDYIKLN